MGEEKTLDDEAYLRYMCKGANADDGTKSPPRIIWKYALDIDVKKLHDDFWSLNQKYTAKVIWDMIYTMNGTIKDKIHELLRLLSQNKMPIDTYRICAKLRSMLCAQAGGGILCWASHRPSRAHEGSARCGVNTSARRLHA